VQRKKKAGVFWYFRAASARKFAYIQILTTYFGLWFFCSRYAFDAMTADQPSHLPDREVGVVDFESGYNNACDDDVRKR
jgi:hypothetical protein